MRRVELLSQLVDSSGSDSGEEARLVNHHSPHLFILVIIIIKIFINVITNQPNREAAGNIEIDVSSIESGSEVNFYIHVVINIFISLSATPRYLYDSLYACVLVCVTCVFVCYAISQ